MKVQEWRKLFFESILLLMMVIISSVAFSMENKGKYTENAMAKPDDFSRSTTDTSVQKNQVVENNKSFVKKDLKVVVIDAGHGGIDEGTSSIDLKYQEKEIVLQIQDRISKLLMKENIIVYFTRQKDEYVSKRERVKFAQKVKADLMISIHCNAASYGAKYISGIETLYADKKNGNSKISNKNLAEIMLKSVSKQSRGKSRKKIKRNDLYILKHGKVPTVIVETGYMTNKKDLGELISDKGQQRIAEGICDGILTALAKDR